MRKPDSTKNKLTPNAPFCFTAYKKSNKRVPVWAKYTGWKVWWKNTKKKAKNLSPSRLGKNIFLVLATADEGKPMLSCYISKELVAEKSLNAGQVVRELGKFIQGGGGGQPFFATAGGKNVDGIQEALDKAVDFVK